MALQLDVENIPLPNTVDRGGKALAHIRDALVGRGWTVMGSGSGTIGAAFENTEQTAGPYDVFDATVNEPWRTGMNPAGTDNWHNGVANSFSNYAAWIRLQEPNTTREWIFQRYTLAGSPTTTSGYMNIWFSPTGFTGGGADKDSIPAAPGQSRQFISNATWFDNTGTNEFVLNLLIEDTARAGDVWPFFIIFYGVTEGNSIQGNLIYESLLNADPNDDEPWICKAAIDGAPVQGIPSNTNNTGWYVRRQGDLGYDTGGGSSVWTFTGGGVPGTTWLNTPCQDGKRRALPVMMTTSDEAWKGRAEHLLYHATNRNYPDTLNLATTSPYLFWGVFLLPWKQNAAPALSL